MHVGAQVTGCVNRSLLGRHPLITVRRRIGAAQFRFVVFNPMLFGLKQIQKGPCVGLMELCGVGVGGGRGKVVPDEILVQS